MNNENIAKEDTTNKNHSKDHNSQINHTAVFLKYAAAALSFISFLTTANGFKKVLGESNNWQAYLISFGIQAIVLGIGMKLADIIFYINDKNKHEKTRFKKLISVLVCLLYASSLLFSSFFSFVFFTDSSYEKVKETDYNMRIDRFLVEETRNLSNINDEIGKILLGEIRTNSVQISSIIKKISNDAEENTSGTIESIKKNTTKSIDDYRIDKSMIENYDNLEEDQKKEIDATITDYNNSIKKHEAKYATWYQKYSSYFDLFLNESTNDNHFKELKKIANEIDTYKFKSFLTENNDLKVIINNNTDEIKKEFKFLKDDVISLCDTCETVKKDTKFQIKEDGLKYFYSTLYSNEGTTSKDVEKASEVLKNIISSYLEDGKVLSTKEQQDFLKISKCFTYLDELIKYKKLDEGLTKFEDNKINQAYFINKEETTGNDNDTRDKKTSTTKPSVDDSKDNSSEKTGDLNIVVPITEVNKEKWNTTRKEDLSTFIRLAKELPDINILLETSENNGFLSLEKYKNYYKKTIKKAYSLYRKDLENISDIERAVNFLFSEHPFMAIFSILISLFMDISSFFIGLFDFLVEKRERERRKNREKEKKRENENNIKSAFES